MIRFMSAAAAVALTLVSTATLAANAPAASSSAGYSCLALPEIKEAASRLLATPVDRQRIEWHVKQAERMCSEGSEQEAKGYLDLAHSLVIKDHAH